MTITGTSGFTDLPTGCWELGGKLTLRGPAISSLDKLGDLRTVGSLELDSTDLSAIDTPSPIDVTGDIAIHHNSKLVDISNVEAHGDLSSLIGRVQRRAAEPRRSLRHHARHRHDDDREQRRSSPRSTCRTRRASRAASRSRTTTRSPRSTSAI